MSNKHRHTLEAIFRDPPVGNLQWREVESLVTGLMADRGLAVQGTLLEPDDPATRLRRAAAVGRGPDAP